MSISQQEFTAAKQVVFPSRNYTGLSKDINKLIDKQSFPATQNMALKQMLDLSQFGLQEPVQVQYFLHNTSLGRVLLTMVGKQEELEETLLEERWQQNIEQAQLDDMFKQFVLYQAAEALQKAKDHALKVNAQIDYEASRKAQPQIIVVNPELEIALINYEQTQQRLDDAKAFEKYLKKRAKAYAALEISIHKLLNQNGCVADLQQALSLIEQPHSANLADAKQNLIIQLHQKRINITQTPQGNVSALAEIHASELIKDHILALHSQDTLNALQTPLLNAQNTQDFQQYLSHLQALYLITDSESNDLSLQAQKVFNATHIDAEIKLCEFKQTLKNQYCARTFLDKSGAVLSDSAEFQNAFYAKPQHLKLISHKNTIFFVDERSDIDFAMNIVGRPFLGTDKQPILAPRNSRIVKDNGKLYLLLPGQTLENMSEPERQRALDAAMRAKENTLSASTLADKCLLNNKRFTVANERIEADLEQCRSDQKAIQFILDEKRKAIEKFGKPNTPQLKPTKTNALKNQSDLAKEEVLRYQMQTHKLVPQKVLGLQARLKQLELELNRDFNNEVQYDAKKIAQFCDEIIENSKYLPPEVRSLVLEKYHKIMPHASPNTNPSLDRQFKAPEPNHYQQPQTNIPKAAPQPSQSIELVKQQVELRNIVIYINKQLEPAPLHELTPELQPSASMNMLGA